MNFRGDGTCQCHYYEGHTRGQRHDHSSRGSADCIPRGSPSPPRDHVPPDLQAGHASETMCPSTGGTLKLSLLMIVNRPHILELPGRSPCHAPSALLNTFSKQAIPWQSKESLHFLYHSNYGYLHTVKGLALWLEDRAEVNLEGRAWESLKHFPTPVWRTRGNLGAHEWGYNKRGCCMRLCKMVHFCAFLRVFALFRVFLCAFSYQNGLQKVQVCTEFCKTVQKALLCNTPFSHTFYVFHRAISACCESKVASGENSWTSYEIPPWTGTCPEATSTRTYHSETVSRWVLHQKSLKALPNQELSTTVLTWGWHANFGGFWRLKIGFPRNVLLATQAMQRRISS